MDEQLLADLCTKADLPTPTRTTTLQTQPLSAVYRLHHPTGTTIYKETTGPFTSEDHILQAAAAAGLPVPAVHATGEAHGRLGILMADLGDPARPPTDRDAATLAAHLHQVTPPATLPVYDAATLAQLPDRALTQVTRLRTTGRLPAAAALTANLAALARLAPHTAGTDHPPLVICHGEYHPTSLHIDDTGRTYLLDWAKAYTGPATLDLAMWLGTRHQPNPARMRALLHTYVAAGGHPDTLQPRGGHRPEHWALAWHRIWSATWILTQAAAGYPIGTDRWCLEVTTRQTRTAIQLLI